MAQKVTSHPQQAEAQRQRWMPILMYHRIVPEISGKDPYHLCTAIHDFEAQMQFLSAEGYHPTTLEELISGPPVNGNPSNRRVAITFDDGYMDVFQNALPILEKHGFPATMFLVVDYLGRTNAWDKGKAQQVPLLGPTEIEKMAGLFSFGSHTRTHPHLAQLGSQDAWEEVVGSKARLKNDFGIDAKTFCYPYGSTTPEVQELVQEAGYTGACGIDQQSDSLFNLRRIDASACRGAGLNWRMKVSGMHGKLRSNAMLRLLKGLVP